MGHVMIRAVEKTVGILGGMGPDATAVFLQELIRITPAERDQDHLKIVVVNDPKIPDRTGFLLGTGPSPVPMMVEAASVLERAGSDFIAIPCNTAHAFWGDIQRSVRIPVLNIVDEAAEAVVRHFGPQSSARRIAILATRGTIKAGLYQTALAQRGFVSVLPDERQQTLITQVIARVKGKGALEPESRRLDELLAELASVGAEGAVLGCTELPLVPVKSPIPLFDSLRLLAEACLKRARSAAPVASSKSA